MRSVMWRRVLATMVAVPLLSVGGCGADEPVVRPTVTASSQAAVSPTPSPSPTLDLTRPPEQPAAMAEPTTDGAVAAATYVMALFPYTFATGDTTAWEWITLESCSYCAGVVQDVAELREVKHEVLGGAVEVVRASSNEISEDRWFSVDMEIHQAPSRRLDDTGAVVKENPGGRFSVVFALSWDGRWHVDEMGVEQIQDAG